MCVCVYIYICTSAFNTINIIDTFIEMTNEEEEYSIVHIQFIIWTGLSSITGQA